MTDDVSLDHLAKIFVQFADIETRGSSPLYEALCRGIAGDRMLLELAACTQNRPIPNVVLAAVHLLLLQCRDHDLANYYPDLSYPVVSGDPTPTFRDFCLTHRNKIEAVLRSRLVQTNEVRRCACLLPAFGSLDLDRPMALVEVGASAGLNLLWDRYYYRYSDGTEWGYPGDVELVCERRDPGRLSLPEGVARIASRVGIDLNPLDVRNDDDVLWLQALVWPEHADRALLLEKALAIAKEDCPLLVAGDALDLLPSVLDAVPTECHPVVFHSCTANQLGSAGRARFEKTIEDLGFERDLSHIAFEYLDPAGPRIDVTTYRAGKKTLISLARCHPHGRWIELLTVHTSRCLVGPAS